MDQVICKVQLSPLGEETGPLGEETTSGVFTKDQKASWQNAAFLSKLILLPKNTISVDHSTAYLRKQSVLSVISFKLLVPVCLGGEV
jgi:hypothetical protein